MNVKTFCKLQFFHVVLVKHVNFGLVNLKFPHYLVLQNSARDNHPENF